MSNLMCPHCHAEVPYGANVCRGCQAEIEYGTPLSMHFLVFIASGFVALKAGLSIHEVVGWIVFAALMGGGMYVCARVFKNRTKFKRVYRT